MTEAPGVTLLIVDASETDRETARRLLEGEGYRLLEAGSGREALEVLSRESVACLLLAYPLPDLSGLELLERLQTFPARPPKVIFTTGFGNERVAVAAMRAGAHDYLPKDALSRAVLLRSVAGALRLSRAETVLLESQERFSSLADLAPGLIWLADLSGRAEFLNQGWLDYTGSRLEDALDAGWLDAFHPDEREGFLSAYRQAVAERRGFARELRLRDRRGSYRWLNCEVKPRFNAEGGVLGLTGACLDVSAQKLAQARSEETYQLLFNSMSNGVLHMDGANRILDCNLAAARVMRRSREEIVGESILDEAWQPVGTDGQPLSLADRPLSIALSTGRAHTGFLGVARGDGSQAWLLSSAVALPAGGAIVSFSDVTDLKLATEALERSEQRYRAMFGAQLSAIIGSDAQGKVISLNPSAQALFGYAEAELLGRNLWVLLDGRVNFTEVLEQARSSPGRSAHFEELTFQRKSGERFPAETVISLLEDAEEPIGYLFVLRDISEQRETESKLAETNRRLIAGRDEERRRLARDLHDGTVQDLIGLSYELANLERQVAQGGLEVAPLELGEYLNRWRTDITTTVRQLRAVISNLRPAGLEEFGLEAVLESYLDGLRRGAARLPQVKLEVEGELGDLPLPVSLNLFRSVQEALQNVFKHAEADTVVIRLRRTLAEVSLSVEDDGRGFVVPEELSELTRQQHFGLLGLHERATLLGGRCVLNSQPGSGAEVFVSLPLGEVPDVAA